MTLDRALSGIPFKVDLFRCHQAAQHLSQYHAASPVEPWTGESTETQVAFKTLFISICHQMNWDVLQEALAEWLLPNTYLRLDEFTDAPSSKIASLLSQYPRQERVRARERAAIFRETASALKALLAPGGALRGVLVDRKLAGPTGYYSAIATIPAYTGDPLEKKARVLAHDLHREGIIPFADPGNLRPAVEYHLIRLYLRSGRVFPTHDAVREELIGEKHATRTRLVTVLRQTVDQAMRQTAFYAGLDLATLNYVEWQLARTICVSELSEQWHPLCRSAPSERLPDDVRKIVGTACPFADGCRTLTDRGYPWFHEPQFEKAIY